MLHSIHVFLTFTLALLGLCICWLRHRDSEPRWLTRFALSGVGLTVTGGILGITLVEKCYEGGMGHRDADEWFTRILHNQIPLAMKRIPRLQGLQRVILPMKVDG